MFPSSMEKNKNLTTGGLPKERHVGNSTLKNVGGPSQVDFEECRGPSKLILKTVGGPSKLILNRK